MLFGIRATRNPPIYRSPATWIKSHNTSHRNPHRKHKIPSALVQFDQDTRPVALNNSIQQLSAIVGSFEQWKFKKKRNMRKCTDATYYEINQRHTFLNYDWNSSVSFKIKIFRNTLLKMGPIFRYFKIPNLGKITSFR